MHAQSGSRDKYKWVLQLLLLLYDKLQRQKIPLVNIFQYEKIQCDMGLLSQQVKMHSEATQ